MGDKGIRSKLNLGFVLSYRAPKYIRMLTLRDALKSNPDVALHEAVNENPGYARYWQTIREILRIKARVNPAAWVVNFRGHEIYWLLRLIAGRRARLVFDELVSPYDAFVNERRTYPATSIISKMVYLVERSILANADIILTDSEYQAQYYAQLFRVPPAKMRVVRGSVDEAVFTPQAPPRQHDFPEPFVIFTYGTFIPLQGMELLLDAAEQLKDLPVRFLIAGGKGRKLDRFLEVEKERGLVNITHLEWINFSELPSYMRGASLCLGGPFGGTSQAMRVITGKALQFLACACPTVVGLSDETRSFFTDKLDCLLVEQGKDGVAKVTGKEIYSSDVSFPNMLHARVLRSPYPHAKILSVDTSEAEKMGVVCIAYKDIPKARYNERQVSIPEKTYRDRTVLPDRVRHAGEGVAAVAAKTEALAEKAMRSIKVEYEILPFVLDAEEAMQPGAPRLHVLDSTDPAAPVSELPILAIPAALAAFASASAIESCCASALVPSSCVRS